VACLLLCHRFSVQGWTTPIPGSHSKSKVESSRLRCFSPSACSRGFCKHTRTPPGLLNSADQNKLVWVPNGLISCSSWQAGHAACCHQPAPRVPCERADCRWVSKDSDPCSLPWSFHPSHQLSCFLPENSHFLIVLSFGSFDLLNALHFLLQNRSHLLENFEKLLFRDSHIACKVSGVLFPCELIILPVTFARR